MIVHGESGKINNIFFIEFMYVVVDAKYIPLGCGFHLLVRYQLKLMLSRSSLLGELHFQIDSYYSSHLYLRQNTLQTKLMQV